MISPMSPDPRMTTRRPGRTPFKLTNRWAAPAVKIPAGRPPGIRIAARVRSRAPIASTVARVSRMEIPWSEESSSRFWSLSMSSR